MCDRPIFLSFAFLSDMKQATVKQTKQDNFAHIFHIFPVTLLYIFCCDLFVTIAVLPYPTQHPITRKKNGIMYYILYVCFYHTYIYAHTFIILYASCDSNFYV